MGSVRTFSPKHRRLPKSPSGWPSLHLQPEPISRTILFSKEAWRNSDDENLYFWADSRRIKRGIDSIPHVRHFIYRQERKVVHFWLKRPYWLTGKVKVKVVLLLLILNCDYEIINSLFFSTLFSYFFNLLTFVNLIGWLVRLLVS